MWPDTDHEGQSKEDNQIQTSPYPTQVKKQTQKDQTCIKTPETDQQDNSTEEEEEEENKKPPDLPNEVAHVLHRSRIQHWGNMCVMPEQEATYKATNCEVNISHRLARWENDQEGQSVEDKQTKTSPYPTQVKIQTQKDQTCIKTPETDQQDNTEEEEQQQNKKPPDLPNEVADLWHRSRIQHWGNMYCI